jgi:hypothetical protein
MVDRLGERRLELAEGIVRQRGKVDHALETVEIGELDVRDVLERLPGRFRCVRQPAVAEVADVEPGHVVAGGLQLLGEDRPDIAQISGDEQFHFREVGRRGGGSARRKPLIGQPWAMVSRR